MQTNHLALMGIQCWQSRGIVNTGSDDSKFHKKSESSASVGLHTQDEEFAGYAALSQRQTTTGEIQKWLWVVPQSSLSMQHLRLLDKIVSATGSQWDSLSIADNYVNRIELDQFLKQSLSAVVILGTTLQWQSFYQSQIYQSKRFIMGVELADLVSNPELKRKIWQSLQKLMKND